MKRGLGAKPLLESEIKDAQKKARSAMEAARLLEYLTTLTKNTLENMVSLRI